MEENKQNNDNQMRIELSDDVAEGVYSNLAVISHSLSEFVLDFIRVMPNTPKAKVKSRVILTPENAKKILLALQDNISKYESQFGPIRIGESKSPNGKTLPLNFGPSFGNSGEA